MNAKPYESREEMRRWSTGEIVEINEPFRIGTERDYSGHIARLEATVEMLLGDLDRIREIAADRQRFVMEGPRGFAAAEQIAVQRLEAFKP